MEVVVAVVLVSQISQVKCNPNNKCSHSFNPNNKIHNNFLACYFRVLILKYSYGKSNKTQLCLRRFLDTINNRHYKHFSFAYRLASRSEEHTSELQSRQYLV